MIYDLVDPSANLIFGAVIDQSLSGQVSWPKFYPYLKIELLFGSLSAYASSDTRGMHLFLESMW